MSVTRLYLYGTVGMSGLIRDSWNVCHMSVLIQDTWNACHMSDLIRDTCECMSYVCPNTGHMGVSVTRLSLHSWPGHLAGCGI